MKLKLLLAIFLVFTSLGAAEEDFYSLHENKEAWIYYSVNESFEGQSNSINMVLENYSSEVSNLISSEWEKAEGSNRYAFIRTDGEDKWLEEYKQLEKGNYYSVRKHLRLYDAGNYTLVQGHKEFWNWFTLRHEVTSNEKAIIELETNLLDHKRNIERVYVGNQGILDSNGWLPIVTLAFTLFILRNHSEKRQNYFLETFTKLKMVFSIFLVFMLVKVIPTILEPLLPINNYFITFISYITLIFGVPATIYFLREDNAVTDLYSILSGLGLVMLFDTLFFQTSYVPGSYIIQFLGFSILLSFMPIALINKEESKFKLLIWLLSYLFWLFLILIGLI